MIIEKRSHISAANTACVETSSAATTPTSDQYAVLIFPSRSRSYLFIVTCSEIIEEVNDDVLKKWYTGLHGIILPIDDEVQENVKKVVTSNPQLIDFKQIKSSGDAFLIATAMKYGLTIITEESKKGEKKIPYVCQKLNVPCVDILGLCEKEKWQF